MWVMIRKALYRILNTALLFVGNYLNFYRIYGSNLTYTIYVCKAKVFIENSVKYYEIFMIVISGMMS